MSFEVTRVNYQCEDKAPSREILGRNVRLDPTLFRESRDQFYIHLRNRVGGTSSFEVVGHQLKRLMEFGLEVHVTVGTALRLSRITRANAALWVDSDRRLTPRMGAPVKRSLSVLTQIDAAVASLIALRIAFGFGVELIMACATAMP